jgi:hypothetical protein
MHYSTTSEARDTLCMLYHGPRLKINKCSNSSSKYRVSDSGKIGTLLYFFLKQIFFDGHLTKIFSTTVQLCYCISLFFLQGYMCAHPYDLFIVGLAHKEKISPSFI